MPTDPLVSLMNLDSPSNVGGRVNVYQPNILRNSARTGALSKFLGLGADDGSISQSDMESAYQAIQDEQDKAEEEKAVRATYPAKVAAESAMNVENLKGQYGLQTEVAKARAAEQAKQEALAAQESMNQARIDAANSRAAGVQAGTTGRTGMIQNGLGSRQVNNDKLSRAKLLDTGKVEPTYPPTNGPMDTLKYYLGMGPYDRKRASENEAASLRGAATSNQPFADASDQDLRSALLAKQPDATEEELQAWIADLRGGR